MKIKWTEPAILDLENIRDFIKRDSEYYAVRFVEKIIGAVENLRNFSEIGRNAPEAEDKNIRELFLHNYPLIYRVDTGRILVLTIIHGSRDLTQKKPKPWDIT